MSFTETILAPLAAIYGTASRTRTWAYEKGWLATHKLPGRTISVGNLTTGGTGKTPMVLWIAEHLVSAGKRVGILTRGYRGSAGTSDEVRLLQARLGDAVSFGVGANRFEQGTALIAKGIEYFILDDGFQHLQLKRDLDILLIDATNPFGGRKLLPAGRLREPLHAISRAHVIVITRSEHNPSIEGSIRGMTSALIVHANSSLDGVFAVQKSPANAAALLDTGNWFAFCGIGNPNAFSADLKRWGFTVAGRKVFKDHHTYTQADIHAITAAAQRVGAAALICTEKDRFNLPPAVQSLLPIFYCKISMQIAREAELMRPILG